MWHQGIHALGSGTHINCHLPSEIRQSYTAYHTVALEVMGFLYSRPHCVFLLPQIVTIFIYLVSRIKIFSHLFLSKMTVKRVKFTVRHYQDPGIKPSNLSSWGSPIWRPLTKAPQYE